MISDKLPSVLQHNRGSISLERALKQIKTLLEDVNPENDSHEDKLNASIDDVETMLDKINRGE